MFATIQPEARPAGAYAPDDELEPLVNEVTIAPELVKEIAEIKIKPRAYQWEAFHAAYEAWATGHRKVLATLCTGGGKTIIFSMIAHHEVKQGGKVLILAHTDELISQAAEKLFLVSGIEAAREKAQDRASEFDSVVVSSVQTMSRPMRLSAWEPNHFSLIIHDETHRVMGASPQKILAHFTGARVLGVTATASRADQKNLGEFFDKAAYNYGLVEAVRDGYLVRPVCKTVPLNIDMRNVRIKRGVDGSDLDATEVARRLDPFLKEIAVKLIEHAGQRKTMVFMPSVDTSMHLAQALKDLGVTAEFVSGDKQRCPDRHEKVQAYRDNKYQFFVNALIGVEGLDIVDVSCVAPLRCTKLEALLKQMFGRATRPLPGLVDNLDTPEERRAVIAASAKPDALLLDFLFLTDRLDLARPCDIIAGTKAIAEEMKKTPEGDLLTIAEKAERDLLGSLAKEAHKHKKKPLRLFDPLARAVAMPYDELKDYSPTTTWERSEPTQKQISELQRHGVDTSRIRSCGLASKWLQVIERRSTSGLCSMKQMVFFESIGVNATYMTKDDARREFLRIKKGWGTKR